MRIKKKWEGRWPPFYDSSSLLVHFNYVVKPNILYNLKKKKINTRTFKTQILIFEQEKMHARIHGQPQKLWKD